MNLVFVIMVLILAILTAVYCVYEIIDIFKEMFNEKYMRHRRGNKKITNNIIYIDNSLYCCYI